jgi:hypothetical protein
MKDLEVDDIDIEEIEMVDDLLANQDDVHHTVRQANAPQPGQKSQDIFNFTH